MPMVLLRVTVTVRRNGIRTVQPPADSLPVDWLDWPGLTVPARVSQGDQGRGQFRETAVMVPLQRVQRRNWVLRCTDFFVPSSGRAAAAARATRTEF